MISRNTIDVDIRPNPVVVQHDGGNGLLFYLTDEAGNKIGDEEGNSIISFDEGVEDAIQVAITPNVIEIQLKQKLL